MSMSQDRHSFYLVGEGGTFALYQGLYPKDDSDYDADRTLTGDSSNYPSTKAPGAGYLKNTFRWPLLVWVSLIRSPWLSFFAHIITLQCLFGTSLTMADGVFTPAVSVTSAVGGIAVAQPSVSKNIIPISIVSNTLVSNPKSRLIVSTGSASGLIRRSAVRNRPSGMDVRTWFAKFCSLDDNIVTSSQCRLFGSSSSHRLEYTISPPTPVSFALSTPRALSCVSFRSHLYPRAVKMILW